MTRPETFFSGLTPAQRDQFSRMEALYREWNAKINVISRRDIDHFAIHHLLHSLAIAKYVQFAAGTRVMDAGTGGGFPGVPLAVMFPDCHFTLVDSIAKKIRVVEAVAAGLGLQNVTAVNGRFESVRGRFDFITGRAVSGLEGFTGMVRERIEPEGRNPVPNGVLYLTGGEISGDLQRIRAQHRVMPLSGWFTGEYFTTKVLVHLHHFT